ncbi:MAG: FAD:protein FMN transferase [Treponema sp.]|nr:FAD:protein FMN transferase [Treponema sp.]
MKEIYRIILGITIASLLCTSCKSKKNQIAFEAMNTYMTIVSYGKKAEAANKQAMEKVLELESYFSTTNPQSDIFLLNQGQNNQSQTTPSNVFLVHRDTYDLTNFSLQMAEETNGDLNPALYPITKLWGFTTGKYTVPDESTIKRLLPHTDYKKVSTYSLKNELTSENEYFINVDDCAEQNIQLDFGAVGKGYAGDEVLKILRENGISSAILDFGGNIQTLGYKPDGSQWKIGIKNPWDGSSLCGISISEKAVVTSGGYERFFTGDDGKDYIHIFNPQTGFPVNNDCASVTIISDQGLYADSLSTALFVMGSDKAFEYWKKHQDFQMVIVTNDEKILYTEGLNGSLITLQTNLKLQELK